MSSKSSDLPYRPCVGITLFNREGRVWVGRRIDGPNEAEGVGKWWQMPQGGIDGDEDPLQAAFRELYEETNIRSATAIGESQDWYTYDLPPELIGKAWGGKYRGQRIKWIAMTFGGDESEIDVKTPSGGVKPEFVEWRWEKLDRLPELIIPFKRAMYEQVVAAFAKYAG